MGVECVASGWLHIKGHTPHLHALAFVTDIWLRTTRRCVDQSRFPAMGDTSPENRATRAGLVRLSSDTRYTPRSLVRAVSCATRSLPAFTAKMRAAACNLHLDGRPMGSASRGVRAHPAKARVPIQTVEQRDRKSVCAKARDSHDRPILSAVTLTLTCRQDVLLERTDGPGSGMVARDKSGKSCQNI